MVACLKKNVIVYYSFTAELSQDRCDVSESRFLAIQVISVLHVSIPPRGISKFR